MKQKPRNIAESTSRIRLETSVGTMVFEAQDNAIRAIFPATEQDAEGPFTAPEGSALATAAKQMGEYFAGKRTAFTFPMQAEGTTFQQQVWQALLRIPYGETRTYGDIALTVGNPKGARAVGGACNKHDFSRRSLR